MREAAAATLRTWRSGDGIVHRLRYKEGDWFTIRCVNSEIVRTWTGFDVPTCLLCIGEPC